MRPRILLIAVLTAAALLCTGCGNASHTRSRTITDMKGRNVVLTAAGSESLTGQSRRRRPPLTGPCPPQGGKHIEENTMRESCHIQDLLASLAR